MSSCTTLNALQHRGHKECCWISWLGSAHACPTDTLVADGPCCKCNGSAAAGRAGTTCWGAAVITPATITALAGVSLRLLDSQSPVTVGGCSDAQSGAPHFIARAGAMHQPRPRALCSRWVAAAEGDKVGCCSCRSSTGTCATSAVLVIGGSAALLIAALCTCRCCCCPAAAPSLVCCRAWVGGTCGHVSNS